MDIDRPLEPGWWGVLGALLTAPDSQLDATMVEKLRALKGKPTEEVKYGLYEIIDRSIYSALASDFVIRILTAEWRKLGGKDDDPAPWRKDYET